MIDDMVASLWAWVTEYPDGSVGLIGGYVPTIGHMPLIGRSEEAVRALVRIARKHGDNTGQRVWLRRYDMAVDYPDEEEGT